MIDRDDQLNIEEPAPPLALREDPVGAPTIPLLAISALCLVVQIPIILWLASQSLDAILTDTISYLRVAQYMLEGRFDLAINGYWSPAYSWLIAAILPFVEDPLVAARVALALSCVVFLLGALRYFQVSRLPLVQFAGAGLLTAIFTASLSARSATPDPLMAGLLLFGLAQTLSLDAGGSNRRAFTAGLWFGLAFLAKAAALPIAVLALVLLHGMRAWAGVFRARQAARFAAISLVGMALLVGPWVTVLSLHYGQFTITTAGKINHAIINPDNKPGAHVSYREFHIPEAGRILRWEEPSLDDYAYWSPFDSPKAMLHQVRKVGSNSLRIARNLQRMDRLGLGLAAAVLGLIFYRPWVRSFQTQPWRLSAFVVASVVAVYMPVSSESLRYFIICYPVLMVAALGFVTDLADRSAGPMDGSSLFGRFNILRPIAVVLVLISCLLSSEVLMGFRLVRDGNYLRREMAMAHAVAEALEAQPPGAIANSGWQRVGMLAAFLSERPWHGANIEIVTLEAAQVAQAPFFLTRVGDSMNGVLKSDPRVEPIALPPYGDTTNPEDWPVRLYRILPVAP